MGKEFLNSNPEFPESKRDRMVNEVRRLYYLQEKKYGRNAVMDYLERELPDFNFALIRNLIFGMPTGLPIFENLCGHVENRLSTLREADIPVEARQTPQTPIIQKNPMSAPLGIGGQGNGEKKKERLKAGRRILRIFQTSPDSKFGIDAVATAAGVAYSTAQMIIQMLVKNGQIQLVDKQRVPWKVKKGVKRNIYKLAVP